MYKDRENIRAKQIEILQDTMKHYNTGNLSRDADGRCVYYPSDKSQGCAIGRLVKDKVLCRKWDNKGLLDIFKELPIDLRELGNEFLNDLQGLHDTVDYWNETGLSEVGGRYVIGMKERHNLRF